MTTLQEYLNNKYPTAEEKEQLKSVDINYYGLTINSTPVLTPAETQQLEGKQLNLTNYPNLEKVAIDGKYLKSPLTNLIINNCSQLKELNCYNNQLTNLTVTNNPQLIKLNCSNCQLTNLILDNNPQLASLDCYNNQLTNLNFLTNLTNLKELILDNNPLTTGLEYLPTNLERLYCNGELAKPLKAYEKKNEYNSNYYDYQAWRKDNQQLIKQANNPFLKQLNLLQSQLTNKEKQITHLKELLQTKPNLTNIFENSPLNINQGHAILGNYIAGNFDASYHLIIKINDNQELIQVKEQEIINLQTKLSNLNTFSEKQKKELESQIAQSQAKIAKLETENQELTAKLTNCKQLFTDLLTKKEQLEQLKVNYLEKGKDYSKIKEKLEELLETERELGKSDYIAKQKCKIINKLITKANLTNQELTNLCQLQTELTKLENWLEDLANNSKPEVNQSKIFKDQASQTEEEVKKPQGVKVMLDEFQTQIIQPPKPNLN